MRRVLTALLAVAVLLTITASASAHAYLVTSSPEKDSRVQVAPSVLVMTFNEPIELLNAEDADVVDEGGTTASAGAARRGDDRRQLQIPLRPGLPDGTYTVRYKVIGADSHIIPGVFVFGVGAGELAAPYFEGDGSEGPSETGVWGTSSRFLEMIGLGGLIGLLAFRWLVWGPAMRGRAGGEGGSDAALSWGRDAFWVGFGVLALGAMVAEAYLLVVHTAGVLGTDVLSALRDAAGISQVLGDTRFGSLVQLRGALLFGLFAIGAILFIREYGSAGAPKPAEATGPPLPALVMAGLLGSVLGGIAGQGHASVADWATVQIGAHLVHMVSVSIWLTGLALVAIVHLRLPKVAPDDGPELAARVLTRFSAVATVAVTVAIASGVVRTLAELSDPAQLWESDYGQSILWKLALLVPISVIALYNRRIVAALARVRTPNGPTLRLVRRTAGAELALALVIVLIATVLVAQVPAGA